MSERSMSELRRKAALDPVGMAHRVAALEAELLATRVQVEDARQTRDDLAELLRRYAPLSDEQVAAAVRLAEESPATLRAELLATQEREKGLRRKLAREQARKRYWKEAAERLWQENELRRDLLSYADFYERDYEETKRLEAALRDLVATAAPSLPVEEGAASAADPADRGET
jgi:hypothetical protein